MSLDIYIGKDRKDLKEHFISFEDDGYYWELYPVFKEVAKSTGKMIDLYDVVLYTEATSYILKQHLEKKLLEIEYKSKEWEVIIGWRIYKNEKTKITNIVVKKKLIKILNLLIQNINKAKKESKSIIFLGD